jgi:hypothetical protein
MAGLRAAPHNPSIRWCGVGRVRRHGYHLFHVDSKLGSLFPDNLLCSYELVYIGADRSQDRSSLVNLTWTLKIRNEVWAETTCWLGEKSPTGGGS